MLPKLGSVLFYSQPKDSKQCKWKQKSLLDMILYVASIQKQYGENI